MTVSPLQTAISWPSMARWPRDSGAAWRRAAREENEAGQPSGAGGKWLKLAERQRLAAAAAGQIMGSPVLVARNDARNRHLALQVEWGLHEEA